VTVSLPPAGDVDARERALAQRGAAVSALRRVADDATATPIYIPYRLAEEWYEGVAAAIDDIESLLRDDPVAALLLAEHVLERLERAELDDSDGHIVHAVDRLELLHAEAALAGFLTGEQLADRLLELARRSGLDAFAESARTHALGLGRENADRLRAALEAQQPGAAP